MRRGHYAAFDPVMDDPQADTVFLAHLFDVQGSGGKRRAWDTMLVADPPYHAGCKELAG